ncbi:MAG: transporter substrate-binding domain-containing protein [Muribaculaceae bacterium]|nr:transporter substrate-binding domain-containing protein [Muribaculaceae bacterium]
MSTSSKYVRMAAYVMLALIFIFVIGITKDCGRIPYQRVEGYSKGDTLDIAILYGPASYYLYDDSISGINHDIAEEFSLETGTPIKIWPVTQPSDGLSKLSDGAFDIVASLPLDNNLRKNYKTSESIFLDRLVLVQLTDSVSGNAAVNSSLDLNGKTVYVAEGSSALQRLRNLSEEIGGEINIVEDPELSDELLCLKVSSGDIPFAVVNEKVAKDLALKNPRIHYDSSVSFTQFQVWIFNSSDSVSYKKFSDWFDSFRLTDDYRKIVDNF